jgi:hypothetical protein
MIPSGYEDGTLGSLKPTDGTGDFTFSRGSDISATRVNADGYIEKGYENTLLGSNDWAQSDSQYEITGGEAGYDGTNDAWLVNKLAAAYFGKGGVSISGVATISIYAKAGSLDKLFVFFGGEAATFDLTNVTAVKSGGTTIAQSIELVSGTTDWYRCSLVINKNSSGNLLIKPLNSSNQDVTGTIYIQDAMLNQGLVAYPYIETTTAPVAGGILEDMPRLDYSNGSCPALLLEPQRTNTIAHSEYLNAIGSKSNSLEMNTSDTKSPEGVYNASKFDFTSGTRYIGPAIGAINDVVVSVFAKAGTHNFVQLLTSGTNQFAVNFDLSNGTSNVIGTAPSELQYDAEDYGNGWYRIWFYYDNAGVNSSVYCWIVNSLTSLRASSVSTSGDVYLYGYQVEQDATYPTSYIPTYGVSQTRLEDEAPFPATFRFGTLGDGESGTIVVKTIVNGLTGNNRFNFFSNGGSANWYWNGFNLYSQTTGGSRQFNLGSTASSNLGTEVKLCMRKSGNTLSCFFNGDEKGSIDIGSESIRYFNDFSTYFMSQSIVEFEEFPTALTDSECIELTTI